MLSASSYRIFYFTTDLKKNLCLVTHQVVSDSVTPWAAACQASQFLTISRSLLKPMSTELMMPSNHLILWYPLLLLPSIFPSIKVFSSESALPIKGPKYWSFSISPPNEYSRLISFRIDWFGLFDVQGTLKSLLQYHSSKASIILQLSAFFMVQFSYPYMSSGKTIALTRQMFVNKVISLFFNMLSRFVIAFLSRSKCLLISCLQSLSTVILESKKIKSVTVSIVSPSVCHEVMGADDMILVFWMLSLAFSLSSFTLIKRLFSSSSLSAYLGLFIFLPAHLIPACDYSAYKLNKQGDNIQPWFLSQFCTSLLFNVSFNCCFLTYNRVFSGDW